MTQFHKMSKFLPISKIINKNAMNPTPNEILIYQLHCRILFVVKISARFLRNQIGNTDWILETWSWENDIANVNEAWWKPQIDVSGTKTRHP